VRFAERARYEARLPRGREPAAAVETEGGTWSLEHKRAQSCASEIAIVAGCLSLLAHRLLLSSEGRCLTVRNLREPFAQFKSCLSGITRTFRGL
jgi:hypothetical protein